MALSRPGFAGRDRRAPPRAALPIHSPATTRCYRRPHAPYVQSERLERYEAAFERLRAEERVYPCFCSRKAIAEAASAPQAGGDEIRYPGTCRDLSREEARRRIAGGKLRAWRFRVPGGAPAGIEDLVRGSWQPDPPMPPGDFVIRRADGVTSYQLAVVVDDAAMGIDEVVRGDDLLPSAVRQVLLYDALGLRRPSFGHVPLLLGPDGARLSKRHRASAIADLRNAGLSAETIVGHLAWLLGLRPSPAPLAARDLVERFELERLPPAPAGVAVDLRSWVARRAGGPPIDGATLTS